MQQLAVERIRKSKYRPRFHTICKESIYYYQSRKTEEKKNIYLKRCTTLSIHKHKSIERVGYKSTCLKNGDFFFV